MSPSRLEDRASVGSSNTGGMIRASPAPCDDGVKCAEYAAYGSSDTLDGVLGTVRTGGANANACPIGEGCSALKRSRDSACKCLCSMAGQSWASCSTPEWRATESRTTNKPSTD